jgi:hypothetical protein
LVENPTSTSVYPLINDIDFTQRHENAFVYGDLTGDTSPELVIYRRINPGVTLLIAPHIYDLSVSPPVELLLQDQVPVDFGLEPRLDVQVVSDSQGSNLLRVTFLLLPACPTYVTQEYTWNGNSFINTPLQFELVPVTGLEAYCEVVLDEASSGWGPEAAITIANAIYIRPMLMTNYATAWVSCMLWLINQLMLSAS